MGLGSRTSTTQRGRVVRTEGIDGILSGTLAYDESARTTTLHRLPGPRLRPPLQRGGPGRRGDRSARPHHPHTVERARRQASPSPTRSAAPRATATTRRATSPRSPCPTARRHGPRTTRFGLPTEVVEPGGATLAARLRRVVGNLLTTVDPAGRRDPLRLRRRRALTDRHGRARDTPAPSRATRPGSRPSLTDDVGRTTTVRRDPFGRVVEATDPLGHTTRMAWTAEGKPARRRTCRRQRGVVDLGRRGQPPQPH